MLFLKAFKRTSLSCKELSLSSGTATPVIFLEHAHSLRKRSHPSMERHSWKRDAPRIVRNETSLRCRVTTKAVGDEADMADVDREEVATPVEEVDAAEDVVVDKVEVIKAPSMESTSRISFETSVVTNGITLVQKAEATSRTIAQHVERLDEAVAVEAAEDKAEDDTSALSVLMTERMSKMIIRVLTKDVRETEAETTVAVLAVEPTEEADDLDSHGSQYPL